MRPINENGCQEVLDNRVEGKNWQSQQGICQGVLATARLQERDRFLQTIYNNTAVAICVLRLLENGRFCYADANPAYQQIAGLIDTELAGKTLEEVLPENTAQAIADRCRTCAMAGKPMSFEENWSFCDRETWLQTHWVPLQDSQDRSHYWIGTWIDISDRKQLEKSLHQREQEFRVITALKQAEEIELSRQLHRSNLLRQITEQIRSQLEPWQLFETAALQIGQTFGASRAHILFYTGGASTLVKVSEFLMPGYPSTLAHQIPVADNPHAQQMLAQDRAFATPDVSIEPLLQPVYSLLQEFQIKSLLAIRTSYQGEPNGAISLQQCDRLRQWTPEEIELLEAIAAQLGIAIAQIKLLEQEKYARVALDCQNLRLQEEINERQTALRERAAAEVALKESEHKYRALVEASTDAIFLVNPETNLILDCNQRAVELFEAQSKDELIGINGATFHKREFTAEESKSSLVDLQTRGLWQSEIEYVTKRGKPFWGSIAAKQINVTDRQLHLVRVADITDRKQREEALQLMVEGTASATGHEFFRACVRNLAEVLQVRYALISEANDPQNKFVRILAFWQGGSWQENIDFDLNNAPCKEVLKGNRCYYKQDLQAIFPNNPVISQLNVQSYLGMPLINSEGKILGILSVLDSDPIILDAGQESILKIFVARAIAELERQQVEEALIESEKRLNTIISTNADGLIVVDRHGIARFANPAASTLLGCSQAEILEQAFGIPATVDGSAEVEIFNSLRGIITAEMRVVEIIWEGMPAYLASLRDITHRKQTDNEIRLLLETTQAISSARDVESALTVILQLICTATGWDVGEAWIPSEEGTALEYSPAWYGNDDFFEEFRCQSEAIALIPNCGLLGRVWSSQQPEWVETVSTDETLFNLNEADSDRIFCRAEIAAKVGLKVSFAVPIIADNRVLAILILYKRVTSAEDPHLIALIKAVAAQLGSLIGRKQVEEALRDSRERLQLALEGSGLGLWDWKLDTGETFLDSQWKTMLGYEEDEMDNSFASWEQLTHPEDIPRVLEAVQNYVAGRSPIHEVEFRLRNKSNEWRWIQARGQIFDRDRLGRPLRMAGTHKDVTESKQAEEALRESERRLRAIFNCSFQYMAVLRPDGTLVAVNQTALNFGGLSETEVTGLPFWETPWWRESQAVRDRLQVAIAQAASGEVVRYETDIRGVGETTISIDFSIKPVFDEGGRVVLLIPEGRDISQAKALQREIALREARLNAFFNGAPIGLAILDHQLQFVQINEVLAQLNGSLVNDHIGKPIREILPNLAPTLEPLCLQALVTGEPIVNQELSGEVSSQPGVLRDWAVSYFLIPTTEGYPAGIGVVMLEITERKQAEQAVRSATERLQYLLMASPGIIFTCKATGNLDITFVSDNISAVLGYEKQDFLADSHFWADHLHPDDREPILTGLRPLFEEGYHSHEYRFRHQDGRYIWLYNQLRLIPDEAGNPVEIIGYGVDISDRKQAEASLRMSEATNRALLNAIPDVMFRLTADGTCVDFKPAKGFNTLIPPHEFLGKKVQELLPRKFAKRVQKACKATLTSGEVQIVEYQLPVDRQLRNYEARLTACNGRDVIAMVRDITHRKQAEKALRESALRERAIAKVIQRMRQTLDIAEIFSATTEELRQVLKCDRVAVFRFNPDWSGAFVAESVGPGWRPLLEGDRSQPETSQKTCPLAGIGSNPVADTYLLQTQGGPYSRGVSHIAVTDIYQANLTNCHIRLLEKFQVRGYVIVPIFCGAKLWGLLATYQNSDPRLWSEAEINIVEQIGNQLGVALQQAELLAQTQKQSEALQQAVIAADAANHAKSEFLANMSHELRTPLNAILGFTQVMNRDSALNPQQQEYLRIINRAGEHLLELINDILEMSKIEAGRTAIHAISFDLIGLLESLEEMLRLKAESKGLQLIFDLADDVPQYIHTDEGKLRQVLINILGNALKFTDRGRVILRVRREGNSTDENLSCQSILFEIEDTGPGIALEEMDKLFEAFIQTKSGKNSQQGTGLGLPISQKFVQLLGGQIKVQSVVNQGSVFSFNIKIIPAQVSEIQSQKPQKQVLRLAPNQRDYRILVVDDRSESRLLLITLLSSIGFTVRGAEEGQQAITLWESWRPDLICMDMQMPIMDGYEATRKIRDREAERMSLLGDENSAFIGRDRWKKVAIMALTANAFEEDRRQALLAGCDDFVGKPFREDVLLEKIGQQLGAIYIFAEDRQQQEIGVNANPTLLGEVDWKSDLKTMSQEWIAQVHRAAQEGNDDLIFELLEQIPEEKEAVAIALRILASNFQFEKIWEVTQ